MTSATFSLASIASAESVPRDSSRLRRTVGSGGTMKTWTDSRIAARTWLAPWTSISSTTEWPASSRLRHLGAQGSIAITAIGGELEEVFALDPLVELLRSKEVIVAPVDLPGARLAGGRRDRELQVGHALKQLGDQGPLADPDWAR